MWASHVRAMAQRQGKSPSTSEAAISINTSNLEGFANYSETQSVASSAHGGKDKNTVDTTIAPIATSTSANEISLLTTTEKDTGKEKEKERAKGKDKGKITAVVNLPQSRYEYMPIEPPMIETPQLRDMGEATPPLEWIGLNRDRLPNLTHQVYENHHPFMLVLRLMNLRL